MKILIAEDELILAHVTAEMLTLAGYQHILIEHCFERAKLAIINKQIDFALLDINLGKGKEGIELAQICQKLEIPFVFTTSYSDKSLLDLALATNPAAYLIKPVTEGSLYATLKIVLANQKKEYGNLLLEFKDGTEWIKLPLKKVLYLKSESIYVNVVTQEHTYLYRGSLQSLMDKVIANGLIQTHRAYAVNPLNVSRIAANHVVVNGTEIPVSRSFRNNMNKV